MKIAASLHDEEHDVVVLEKHVDTQNHRWYRIETRDGREGIVPEECLDDLENNDWR